MMLERTWGARAWANASTVRGGRPADCRWLVGIEANGEAVSGLLPVGCSTRWVPSPQDGLGAPNSSVSSSRCRSASLSIGYAMAILQTDGCWRDASSRQWDRVGRSAGGSSWPPRTHHPGAARPARRVVVGNLGYDVSFTLPKSYSLLPAFADSDTAAAAAVESVYTEAVGRTFGWLERQCAYGMRGQPTAASPAGVIATRLI